MIKKTRNVLSAVPIAPLYSPDRHKQAQWHLSGNEINHSSGKGGDICKNDNVATGCDYKRTTTECLHRYVIPDAIVKKNVRGFRVVYWRKLKRNDRSLRDDDVTSIDNGEFDDNVDRMRSGRLGYLCL
ncbi:hypothetical protein [uncultured Sulfitobacter sp.]|uniref:hypothetical protein n=1 Tax=uncultured Sulfitobacter sp. TaxID=191468 RepID=UPI002631A756|nr:hypothetical protein [uncultured Sulfitobacter sp.]